MKAADESQPVSSSVREGLNAIQSTSETNHDLGYPSQADDDDLMAEKDDITIRPQSFIRTGLDIHPDLDCDNGEFEVVGQLEVLQ